MMKKASIILTFSLTLSGFAGLFPVQANNNITLDDGTVTEYINGEYVAYIPAGHPRIPLVVDDGEKIMQCTIPEKETEGYAKAGDTYIKFVKSEDKGFVLQYDDHYEYDFGLDGNVEYTSTAPDTAVYENGMIVVKAVSDEPVTITASNGEVSKSLTIDKTVKAPINIMLVIGQSNSDGTQGDSTLSDKPKPGVGYTYCCKWHGAQEGETFSTEMYNMYGQKYLDDGGPDGGCCFKSMYNPYVCSYLYTESREAQNGLSYDERIERAQAEHAGKLIDLSYGWQGFWVPYAKEYYEKTGEKSLAVSAGVGGSSMFEWYPEYDDGLAGPVLYNNTIEKYNEAIGLLSDNYEIRSKGYFWIQGETDIMCWANYVMLPKTDPDCNKLPVYKERLLSLDKHLKNELGMEYGALFVVRYTATESINNNKASKEYSKIVPVRAAQFELAEEHDDIYIATDLCEQIPNSMTDHGFHYSQEGYNLIGKAAADSMAERRNPKADNSVKDIAAYIDYTNKQYDDGGVILLNPLKGLTAEDSRKYSIVFNTYPISAEFDNFSIEYDRSTGLKIEDGIISIPENFTETELKVTAGNLTKTFTVRNINFKNSLEARFDEENNYIHLKGEIGRLAGAGVGISLVNTLNGETVYADQINTDENNCIDYLIRLDENMGGIEDYTVSITVPDSLYQNNKAVTLKIAGVADRVDMSAETVINRLADENDMHSYSLNLRLDSIFNRPVDGKLICAYYDENGSLIGIDDSNITLDQNNGYECTVTKNIMYNMHTAKAFIFDSYNGLIPLTDNIITIKR